MCEWQGVRDLRVSWRLISNVCACLSAYDAGSTSYDWTSSSPPVIVRASAGFPCYFQSSSGFFYIDNTLNKWKTQSDGTLFWTDEEPEERRTTRESEPKGKRKLTARLMVAGNSNEGCSGWSAQVLVLSA